MKCKEHPRYQGKSKPATCISCWCVYMENIHRHYPRELKLEEIQFLVECLGSPVAMEQLIETLEVS